MTVKRILIITFFSLFSYTVSGQSGNPYEIIRALAKQMDTNYPIVDTLYPFVIASFTGKDWNVLTGKEKRRLKYVVKKEKGIKLSQDSLPDRKLIPSSSIFEAFENVDSTGIKVIEQYQPFYMLTYPLFFAGNTKAIVALNLIKGFGYTYIFERRNNDWVIIKSIYRWM
jgi:hypothetical protein